MIVNLYPWLAGAVVLGLILAFGGDYDTHRADFACAVAHCGQPLRLGGWTALP